MPINNPILSPSSTVKFGQIPEITNSHGVFLTYDLPIILPAGDRSFGYVHIYEKHYHKISHYHRGMTPIEYVFLVTSHYNEIYLQENGALRLIKYNGIKNAIIVQHSTIFQECYKIITAYPLDRLPNFAKKNERLIWKR